MIKSTNNSRGSGICLLGLDIASVLMIMLLTTKIEIHSVIHHKSFRPTHRTYNMLFLPPKSTMSPNTNISTFQLQWKSFLRFEGEALRRWGFEASYGLKVREET